MKHITFIRHAKSDWSNTGQKDFDRTLNERGRRVAPKMGKKLQELSIKPDLVLCSPSVRTMQTLELIVEQLDYNIETTQVEEQLYEASVRNIAETIAGLDDEFKDIIIISHNPSLTYFCEYLTDEKLDNIPTCGVVRVSFPFEKWEMISKSTGNMDFFIYPEKFGY